MECILNIRMNAQEMMVAEDYALTHNISVEEAVKSAFFEMLVRECTLSKPADQKPVSEHQILKKS